MPAREHPLRSRLNELAEELLGSIVMLLEAHRERSARVLLYSGVDILGALDTNDGQASKAPFVEWANQYMVPPTGNHPELLARLQATNWLRLLPEWMRAGLYLWMESLLMSVTPRGGERRP